LKEHPQIPITREIKNDNNFRICAHPYPATIQIHIRIIAHVQITLVFTIEPRHVLVSSKAEDYSWRPCP
jgi:hypothetical protein